MGLPKRSRNLGRIPGLPVVMSNHHPEAPEGDGRNLHAKLPNVAFQKCAGKVLLPRPGRAIGSHQEGTRKASSPPEPPLILRANLRELESAHFHEPDPARQGFGTLAKQFGRSTPQDQKTGRERLAVGKNPEDGKQLGLPLHLVNHHQSTQITQRQHGLLQAPLTDWVFQVEIFHPAMTGNLAGQGGFAALARTVKRHHGIQANRPPKLLLQFVADYHPCIMVTRWTKYKDKNLWIRGVCGLFTGHDRFPSKIHRCTSMQRGGR